MSGFVIWTDEYGYYDGKILRGEDVNYLSYHMFKDSPLVKVYKSEKSALTMAEIIKSKCEFVNQCIVLPR